MLLHRLAALDAPNASHINSAIEELSSEREPEELVSPFVAATRKAMDFAFRHDEVEKIVSDLESFIAHEDASVKQWAMNTLAMLHARSPTSLKVALKAIRLGKSMRLLDALNMEMKIATAFCVRSFLIIAYMLLIIDIRIKPALILLLGLQLFLSEKTRRDRNGRLQHFRRFQKKLFPDSSMRNHPIWHQHRCSQYRRLWL